MKKTPAAQPPAEFTGLKLRRRPKKAVGLPAIISSFQQIGKYMTVADGIATMRALNQQGGFDCPGCAWPDPGDDRFPMGEYCENGVKAIAEEAQKATIGADFFEKNSVAALAVLSDFEIGKKGRLAEPMVLRPNSDNYEPISWENAFSLIAENLAKLASPDEAAFYTSGRTSNEAAFLWQLFAREFGTNNLPDCSNMCHESSGLGLSKTIGIGKGTVKLEDFDEAELVIVIGQNPGTNHPRMLAALEKTKLNGGKIIAINPLPEPGLMHFIDPKSPWKMLTGGTPLADLFLQVRINGDVALLQAIAFLLFEKEKSAPGSVIDHDFLKKTVDFAEFQQNIESLDFQKLVEWSGVAEAQIRHAADLVSTSKKIITCWAMGLTQHENAVDNITEVVNLHLLRGAIGKPGAGLCPVRGHSNVQGDRTMGIFESPTEAFLKKMDGALGIVSPRKHGFSVTESISAMHDGRCKVFIAMGGNFLSATPDTEFTAEALRRTKLTVHISTKLNRSHLITGKTALILPCLGRTDRDFQKGGDQFVTVENSMGIVSSSRGVLRPPSDFLKSEPAIAAGIAAAFFDKKGLKSRFDWQKLVENYDSIRDLIEKAIAGFEDFNQKVREPNGFYLPNGPRDGQFTTADGMAHFTKNEPLDPRLPDGQFLMMTIRTHDQFNTTIYGLNDRYRGILGERRVVLMNAQDIENQRFKSGSVVNLRSHHNGQERLAERFILVEFDIPRGCVATYFPEANALVPLDKIARGSKTPASKSVVVTVHPVLD